jgi:outer membrane lipoprotein-sorting protein
MNLYAVDPLGHVTLLGPINATSTTPLTFNTNLDKFMLVVSPEGNLTTYAPNTSVAFRSAVPEGLSVIPLSRTGEGLTGDAKGEKVAASVAPSYNVPMLNVSTLPVKKETEVKVKFADTAHIKRADFFVTPNFNDKGLTRVKAKFHDLTDVPTNAFLTLWAVSPDGKFFRIGSTPNKGNPNVATIDSDKNNTNVPFPDFGLFMTVEPTATATQPTTTVFGTIIR